MKFFVYYTSESWKESTGEVREFNTVEDLMKFSEEVGCELIFKGEFGYHKNNKEKLPEIEIIDDWKELAYYA